MSIERPRFGQRFRHWLRGNDVDYGCAYCAEDANRSFGHLLRVAVADDGGFLIECPRCHALYHDDGTGGDEKRLTLAEAQRVFPDWVPSSDTARR
jgi:hypothetical protein